MTRKFEKFSAKSAPRCYNSSKSNLEAECLQEKRRKIFSIFSGAGGFTLGAHMAGFQTVLAIDIDSDVTFSYPQNFPFSPLLLTDISKLDPATILREVGIRKGETDGVIGGPPCQGFSFIGKRNPSDERNRLVMDFFRVVKGIRPKFFVLENVPGILSTFGRETLDSGIDLIARDYAVLGPLILDAAEYGAATVRKRAFLLGYRTRYCDPVTKTDLEDAKCQPATVKNAIADLPKLSAARKDEMCQYWAYYPQTGRSDGISQYADTARQKPPEDLANRYIKTACSEGKISGFQPTRHTPNVVKRFAEVLPGEMDRISKCPRLAWDSPCGTLRAGTGKDRGSYQAIRPIHPEENRVISVREAARIQGFPDWFQFHPTKWHSFRMIGNSVSPYISKAILGMFAKRVG